MGKIWKPITLMGTKTIKIRALIDTGADRTLIDTHVAKRAGLHKTKLTIDLRTISGGIKRVPLYDGSLSIDGVPWSGAVAVTPLPAKVLIGHDILESLPAEVEISNQRLILKNIQEGIHA